MKFFKKMNATIKAVEVAEELSNKVGKEKAEIIMRENSEKIANMILQGHDPRDIASVIYNK